MVFLEKGGLLATPPRKLPPSGLVMVTRRILQRRVRMRPSEDINALILYLLALSADKYGIRIHCFQVLGNHYHIILSYTKKRLPAFMQHLNGLLGRALNCHQGECEFTWSPGSFNSIDLLNHPATIHKYMLYVLSNVTAAGLVRSAKEWPGVKILPHGSVGGSFVRTGPTSSSTKRVTCPTSLSFAPACPRSWAIATWHGRR